MKRIIFLALILMAPAASRAQIIKISLQDKLLKGGGFKQTRPTNQTDGFVGIDSVNFKTWGIEVFSFSSRQADNNISIKEGVTKERLLAYYKNTI